ncbi:MAG: thioredoxin domain-containing protein [Desulfobacteraceae bacterium]|nr:thioredoxin domain-containing protein [Desulfobacteraceae bacterium]
MNQIKSRHLSYDNYRIIFICLLLIGIIDSVYLSISHFRIYTDIGYESFCSITKTLNCDSVSLSEYSILLGIPIPIIGIFGYSFLLLLLLFSGLKYKNKKKAMWSLIFITASSYCFFSIYLSIVSWLIINSYCIMCILNHAINFFMAYLSWLILRRFGDSNLIKSLMKDIRLVLQTRVLFKYLFLPFFSFFIITGLFMPNYWEMSRHTSYKAVTNGLTPDGSPWIGALNPILSIEIFSDYQCIQCKKTHLYLQELVSQHPNKIRLIHRHYPMDHEFNDILVKKPFHVGAGKLSIIAIYAASQNKFWEATDFLFEFASKPDEISIKRIAEELNLSQRELYLALENQKIREKLRYDIREGLKMGITGTPSFIIYGALYEGTIPAHIIEKIIE